MRTGEHFFSRASGAIAAALIGAAIAAIPLSGSFAQNDPKKRAQKYVPPKPQVQPRRAMPNGMMPKGVFRGQPNQFQKAQPNIVNPNAVRGPNAGALQQNPNARSLGAGPAVNLPGRVGNNNATGNLGNRANFNNRVGAFGNQKAFSYRNPFANRQSFSNRQGFGNRQGFANRFGDRGFTNRDPMRRSVNAMTPQLRQVQRFSHRSEMMAVRARMPFIPLPGERNFTGVPPVAETRYIQAEMVCQWDTDITPQRIEEIARQHNLTILNVQRSALTGATMVRFAIGGNRSARDVVRAMEAERIVSQPNYLYEVGQAAAEPAAAESQQGGDQQYVANKLRLAEVHKIATGKGVLVAVIDSEIDQAHPEISKGIVERFDAVGKPDQPHLHGTGMAGAIVSQDRLMGVAPGARALAVHAFSTGATQQSPQATTQSIVAGIDWALQKGARIINMSFAGPQDPILALHLKKASEKGAILIAAVGNAGPKSPPLYPAADPRVIGVTAIDENDKLYNGANIGAQVAVAAPGVDVMVPAPAGTYQLTTGTSVAAAHVSGVAALLLEKHPEADAQLILEVLTASATRLGTKRDDKVGWGLIDPLAALGELEARLADTKVAAAPTRSGPPPGTQAATPAAAPARASAPRQAAAPERTPATAPAAATTRSALPRPGLYLPKH